jgi:hypothetical protein
MYSRPKSLGPGVEPPIPSQRRATGAALSSDETMRSRRRPSTQRPEMQ